MKDCERLLAAKDGSDLLGMADRRGKSDPLEVVFRNTAQPLKADRQLDTTPIVCKLVDFIDDHVPDSFEVTLHDFSGENRLERFGSSDEKVWRYCGLFPAL